nr:phospholipase A(1) LCAT3-like [Tanacetum cinerariifolium]
MGGKWWCFGKDSDEEVCDLDPILLVSGVGGSILNSKPKSWLGLTTRVWVRILLADLEFRKRVWSLYNPQTGYTEALDDTSDIVVPDDDYGLYAIDILDPSFFVEGLESYFFVSRWSMHQLLVECPSIYEMLPNPEYNWKKQPEIMVWRNRSENGQDTVKMERYGTSGCVGLFVEALKDNEIEYNKKTIPLPFNYDIYQWAATTRKMLNSVRLPEGIPFYNIYGTSLETPFDVCYGSETDPIDDATDICHTLPEYTFVDGDGTVPAESAMADGFEAVERVGIPGAHRALLRDETVFEYIRKWLGIEELGRRSRVKTSKVVDVGLA